MSKIKIILLIILSIFLYINSAFSDWCKYESEIEQCVSENNWWTPRSIEDFVCIQSTDKEKIAYQIVLDFKFKEIDEEVESYLDKLEKSKDLCFWENKSLSYLECIQDIYDRFKIYWKYWEVHNNYCSAIWEESIIQETVTCLWWETTVLNVQNYFNETDCMELADYKMSIYQEVALNILKINKQSVIKDARKEYVQEERSTYDTVLDLFMINLWYIERIWMKWPSKTLYPY